MSEQPPIDLETLLAPISEREPAGEWLRYEGTYDAIGEARREDDESLPQGVWQTKLKRADWSKVAQLSQKALVERSKDLQIAVWLCEAWLKLYGVPGLTLGVRLCHQLMVRFWNTLYPLIEEGESSYRVAPLEYLSQRVSGRLKEIPLTDPIGDKAALTWIDWERALRNEKVPSGGGEILPASVLGAAAATRPHFYSTLFHDLTELDAAAQELEDGVLAQLPDQPAMLRQLRSLIHDIKTLIAQYTPVEVSPDQVRSDAAQLEGVSSSAVPDEAEAKATMNAKEETVTGPIRSRTQAYQRLAEAAEYLQRTEPHSPVPYLVKRAIAWGNMDLIQLLNELVAGGADRQGIYALLGVKSPQ